MSSFNVKSEVIQNRDASPPVLNNPEVSQGLLKEALGVAKIPAAITDAGSQFRLLSIPSNARLSDFEYAQDDIGTSSLDVAVWYPTQILQGGQNTPAKTNESVLISSSAFATAILGTDGGIDWTSAMSASTPSLVNRSQPLWQLLGLSTDPGIDLDIGFTVRTATVATGYVGLRAKYVD